MAILGGATVLRNEMPNIIHKGACLMLKTFLTQIKLVEKHKQVLKITFKETFEEGILKEVTTGTFQALLQARDAKLAAEAEESKRVQTSHKLQS